MSEDDSDLDHKWEIYVKHRDSLESIRVDQVNIFDRSIQTLSSGALGFSLVLVSAFAIGGKILGTNYLILAWLCLLVTIGSNLCSYKASADEIEREIGAMDSDMREGKLRDTKRSRWSSPTEWLNLASIIFFLVGAGFLLCFGYVNARDMEKSSISEVGSTDSDVQKKFDNALGSESKMPLDDYMAKTGVTTITPPVTRPIALPQVPIDQQMLDSKETVK